MDGGRVRDDKEQREREEDGGWGEQSEGERRTEKRRDK